MDGINEANGIRDNAKRRKIVSSTHDAFLTLNVRNRIYAAFTAKLLTALYREDLGDQGDMTSDALVLCGKKAVATIIAGRDGIISGTDEAEFFLRSCRPYLTSPIRTLSKVEGGSKVRKGSVIATYAGRPRDLLSVERTILNVIGRMSGIATYANLMVKSAGRNVLVVPTRKTYWGPLDKKACHDGGAGTHRINLSDAILIKDNHLKMSGGIRQAFCSVLKKRGGARFIEIEAENELQVKEIVKVYGEKSGMVRVPLFILLDNMSPKGVGAAVKFVRGSGFRREIFLEASGGINVENIKAYAGTGVDVLSCGAMTHSAPWFDISMEFSV